MTVRNLNHMFEPRGVAVIGASNRLPSVGGAVMRNLLAGGFAGPVMPVNPKYEAVAGVLAYPDVASLPITPDLAVLCTPAPTLPEIIGGLGERGTRAAIVLSAGTDAEHEPGVSIRQAMLEAARPHMLRLLGPNCLGLLVPGIGLNASFAHVAALPGHLAFIHQSGALCTALLDWARTKGIGFSHFVSLGDSADADFGDILDYLGGVPEARAVLLYVESITEARKFMSAARGAARNKPVIVIKSGRVEEGARAAASHTGALAGADDVYDTAFRRAGMLRVLDTDEMFDAVETLAHLRSLKGERMAILTNGGGPGVIATDALIADGGQLAALTAQTIERLSAVLPGNWSRGNPIDIIGDATGERYAEALRILLDDPGIDAILVLHAPTAMADPTEVARSILAAAADRREDADILTSWMGGATVEPARQLFAEAGVPTYPTPEQAVRGFMHIVAYSRNQRQLLEMPPSIPSDFEPVRTTAQLVIEGAIAAERDILTEPESKAVLAAYGIPVVETRIVKNAADAAAVADRIGYPVAIKILSPDVTHKSDVGGVALDLADGDAAVQAAEAMAARLHKFNPDAKLTGFTVQKMARRPGAHELIVGAVEDPIFGPVILFGQGGTGVEVIADKAVALPPLNIKLARELIERTRVAKLLAGYRDRPAADLDAIALTLVKVAQLVTDIPEVLEIDVNPLLADQVGVVALDARIRVAATSVAGPERLAIRPYPQELEEWIELDDREILLRPIRPEDEPAHHRFLSALRPEDIRFRFFGQVREFPHSQMARFTQIDYDREMAFVATETREGERETIGVVRAVTDPNNAAAEFAIVVSADAAGIGLGRNLMEKIVRYCRARGTRRMVGQVLSDNTRMLRLADRLGFDKRTGEGGVFEIELELEG